MRHPQVAARLAPLIEGGLVATTALLDADALYNARASADYAQICSDRRLAYEYSPTNDVIVESVAATLRGDPHPVSQNGRATSYLASMAR